MLNGGVLCPDTPRRRTRRTSGLYESDPPSNGKKTAALRFLLQSRPTLLKPLLSDPTEDSGNSSDDSDADDTLEKTDKASPWRGRLEPPACGPDEEPAMPEEEEEEEEEAREQSVAEAAAADGNMPSSGAVLMDVPTSPCPSMPQEKAEEPLNQSEKQQGAEPAEEPQESAVYLEKEIKLCPGTRTLPGHEVVLDTPLSRTSAPPSSPPSTAEDESRVTPLLTPRGKGRRVSLRDSETPPIIPHCNAGPAPAPSPLQATLLSTLKRQEEPMVVLHCLPSQHLLPKPPSINSDTDSATEEEEEEEEAEPKERGSTLKRKAADQRTAEKKLCTGSSQDHPPAPPAAQQPEWAPENAEDKLSSVAEEKLTPHQDTEVHVGTAVPASEPPGTPTEPPQVEELEPQMGPEALVCHEVDLDDPDEKDKPPLSSVPLLMMQKQAPPTLPLAVHPAQPQVRPFLMTATPLTCPEARLPAKDLNETEEERGPVRGEQGGDSSPGFEGSTSSSSSLLFMQEPKDRGKTATPQHR